MKYIKLFENKDDQEMILEFFQELEDSGDFTISSTYKYINNSFNIYIKGDISLADSSIINRIIKLVDRMEEMTDYKFSSMSVLGKTKKLEFPMWRKMDLRVLPYYRSAGVNIYKASGIKITIEEK